MIQRRAARWVTDNFSSYDSVSNVLCELGWRSLADRQIDARMIMIYKKINGYVAIQLPSYFERPTRYTRHMYPLAFRQIHTEVKYYQNPFYPASIVQGSGTDFRLKLSYWMILTPLGEESVTSLTHSLP